jgi:hypothetical protein
MQQTVLIKSLSASSSLQLGSFSSAATTLYTTGSSASVGTSSGAVATQFDTSRRVTIWSSAVDLSGLLVTINGVTSAGNKVTETLAGPIGTSVRTTIQDFYQVNSILFSSQNPLAGILRVALSTRAGTPWIVADTWRNPFDMTVQLSFSSTANSMSANFETTLEDITQATLPGPTKFLSTTATTVVPWYPTPTILQLPGSTFVSTAIDAVTMANITTPIAAWRVTLISSAVGAGTLGVSVLQSG